MRLKSLDAAFPSVRRTVQWIDMCAVSPPGALRNGSLLEVPLRKEPRRRLWEIMEVTSARGGLPIRAGGRSCAPLQGQHWMLPSTSPAVLLVKIILSTTAFNRTARPCTTTAAPEPAVAQNIAASPTWSATACRLQSRSPRPLFRGVSFSPRAHQSHAELQNADSQIRAPSTRVTSQLQVLLHYRHDSAVE
jgi:hypothetical protein